MTDVTIATGVPVAGRSTAAAVPLLPRGGAMPWHC